MDTILSFGQLANLLASYGPIGLVVVIWYFDIKTMRKLNEKYRGDTQEILSDHKEYMDELRNMYRSNVKLVDSYEDLAKDLKEVVIMNTTAMTHLADDINRNQYCPIVRVEKKNIGVGA